MCGIVGYVGREPPADLEGRVDRALDAMQHRGPEARGWERMRARSHLCVLGHTRLRIIDVTPAGDQPAFNEERDVAVVYNGELYNHAELRRMLESSGHVLASMSDTEVIAHLYEECGRDPAQLLPRLRGMFAFALFDAREGKLVLARDRLGIKPMYIASVNGGIVFASEVRALLRTGLVSNEPDAAGLTSYLRWGAVTGPRTILASIEEMPAASYLEVSEKGRRAERWWTPEIRSDHRMTHETAVEKVGLALEDSVRRHLVADRPVGVFLSGGVDSGALATLAASSGTLRALTVVFGDAPGDEDRYATDLATTLGVEHEKVVVSGDEVAHEVPSIIAAMDQPTVDGTNTWIVSRAAAACGLVVALSGIGGDELFGGYPSFSMVPRLQRWQRLLSLVPGKLREHAAVAASARNPGGRATRVFTAMPDTTSLYLAYRSIFGPQEVGDTHEAHLDLVPNGRHPADVLSRLEIDHYLKNQLLRDADTMGMAHSLEIRVPLLDHEVLETVLSVPAPIRTAGYKRLLSEASGFVAMQPKKGFVLPFDHWLRGPIAPVIEEGLLSDALPLSTVIPAPLRRRVWRGYQEGRVHWSRPWALTVVRRWAASSSLDW